MKELILTLQEDWRLRATVALPPGVYILFCFFVFWHYGIFGR